MKINLTKPTPADMEAVGVALAAFRRTVEQFSPVVLRGVSEAVMAAVASMRQFRLVLENNIAQEEARRDAKRS